MSPTVVIAGGGPSGLMLAAELGLKGVHTIVMERLPEANGWSRSLTLQARSVEVLSQRGLDWFDDYPHIRSYNFGLLELTGIIDPGLVPLLVPQRHLERHLEDRALELGVDIRRGHEVIGFEQDAEGVTVRVRAGERESEVRGDYLVGCDGGSSKVRKLAGIGFPGSASTINGITGDVNTPEDFQQRLPPKLHDTGLFAVTPLAPGQHRVTVIEFGTELTSKNVPVTIEEFRQSIQRVAGVDPEILDIGEAHWLSRFGNPTRLAERYRDGRVLLAGDSAHIHLPVSGQGLNTGIQDAWNLGWKLAAVVRGEASDELLDTYHSERHPVGEGVCMNTRAQDSLMYPLERVAPLRELFAELLQLDEVNTYLTDMVTGIGIRYPMGKPTDGPVHTLLGRRIGNVALAPVKTGAGRAPEATTSWRTLHSGRGVLLNLSGGEAPDIGGWTDRVDTVSAEPTLELDAAVLLLRPDGHVAHVDRDGADQEGLRLALKTWFGDATDR
ncbi:FAD-dependent monooxygenase [Streptomyces sp. NPDC058221]|uniref:FAD-dependent monooxygenase n=1 Tax=Streptomyces sp. NPDC058221 TaxID=3346388 RepID=UPI0036DFDD12